MFVNPAEKNDLFPGGVVCHLLTISFRRRLRRVSLCPILAVPYPCVTVKSLRTRRQGDIGVLSQEYPRGARSPPAVFVGASEQNDLPAIIVIGNASKYPRFWMPRRHLKVQSFSAPYPGLVRCYCSIGLSAAE